MVAFRNVALLALTAAPSVIATIDFLDNYVQPYEVKPVTYSEGWNWEHTDLIGGLLGTDGNILTDLLDGLNIDLDINLFGKKKPHYGHGVAIVGGLDGDYNTPSTVYHSSGKPFTVSSISAFCCVGDLHKKCDLLDCHIKLHGYDKVKGGKKIYDHDFYIPKPSKGHGSLIDIDVLTEGVVNLGSTSLDLSALDIEINLLDLITVDVNNKKQHRGKVVHRPSKSSRGHGLLVNIDLDVKL